MMQILIILIVGLTANFIGFQAGKHNVKQNIVVQWFPLGQQYKFYGTCQTEVYFDGVRGVACATLKEQKE